MSSTPKLDSFSHALRHVVTTILRSGEDDTPTAAIHHEGITDMDMLVIPERDYHVDPLEYPTGRNSQQRCPIPIAHRYLLTRLQNYTKQYLADNDNRRPDEATWLSLTPASLYQYGTPRTPPAQPPLVTKMDAFTDVLQHVVQEVLCAVETDALVSALEYEDITDIGDLIILERNFIDDPLEFPQISGEVDEIPMQQRSTIIRLQNFARAYYQAHQEMPPDSAWMALTPVSLDSWGDDVPMPPSVPMCNDTSDESSIDQPTPQDSDLPPMQNSRMVHQAIPDDFASGEMPSRSGLRGDLPSDSTKPPPFAPQTSMADSVAIGQIDLPFDPTTPPSYAGDPTDTFVDTPPSTDRHMHLDNQSTAGMHIVTPDQYPPVAIGPSLSTSPSVVQARIRKAAAEDNVVSLLSAFKKAPGTDAHHSIIASGPCIGSPGSASLSFQSNTTYDLHCDITEPLWTDPIQDTSRGVHHFDFANLPSKTQLFANHDDQLPDNCTDEPVTYEVKVHDLTYSTTLPTDQASNEGSDRKETQTSIIDPASGGGIAGENCLFLFYCTPERYANAIGIDEHQVPHMRIGTFASLVEKTPDGPIIIIMHQYAHGKGSTVHSAIQWQQFGHDVDVRSKPNGGKQCVTCVTTIGDCYTIPIHIRGGLPYIDMRRPTFEEFSSDLFPKVIVTSNAPWDPSVLNFEYPIPTLVPPVDTDQEESVEPDVEKADADNTYDTDDPPPRKRILSPSQTSALLRRAIDRNCPPGTYGGERLRLEMEESIRVLDDELTKEVLGRTFLSSADDRGQRFRGYVFARVNPGHWESGFSALLHKRKREGKHSDLQFLIRYHHPMRPEEVMNYLELSSHLKKQDGLADSTKDWPVIKISDHEGPLARGDPRFRDSVYNVKVHWSDGSITFEPLTVMRERYLCVCFAYAQVHLGLLEIDEWKDLKNLARSHKKHIERFSRRYSCLRRQLAEMGVSLHSPPMDVVNSESLSIHAAHDMENREYQRCINKALKYGIIGFYQTIGHEVEDPYTAITYSYSHLGILPQASPSDDEY